ncbi:response regulator [Roseovarius sp. A21]|uniref:histidine kinase n=1 Tax=Roseovarius bejariae TaxID=2576383 RepID=A0A844CQ01_9RHOB|nr:ATP-binding protein [Roseovarius bejariae]MRU16927.1 response regulator [Roseovarius bejariae]
MNLRQRDLVVAFSSFTITPVRRASADLRSRVPLILAGAAVFALSAILYQGTQERLVFGFISATLACTAGGIFIVSWFSGRADAARVRRYDALLGKDIAPLMVAGGDGRILYANEAACDAYDCNGEVTLAGVLRATLANPGPILFRLGTRAQAKGVANEDILTQRGLLRMHVHQAGPDRFLWRIETASEQPRGGAGDVPLPMLTVGRNDAILFMNSAARALVGERAKSLDRVCPRLPLRSGQINEISTHEGLVPCLAVELEGTAGRREIFLLSDIAATERGPEGWDFVDELPIPILKVRRTGEIQLSNAPARALLGVESCSGAELGDLVEGLGRSLRDWLEEAAAGRGTQHSEVLKVKSEAREAFIQVTLNRLSEAGETVLVAVLTDATKLKSLEAQFVQSQKMQAIGQLAGGVAHDFNNLLTAISGHCDLLLTRHDEGDEDFSDLMQINQNANRAAALVGQLLAYSRKQTLQPQRLDLRGLLSDMTHLLGRLVGEKVTLNLSHDPQLWETRADKRQLEQVFMNLVVNARDAMPEGGTISVETENLTLEAPWQRDRAVVAPGQYVKVSVRDSGVGIAPDKVQKVFEPFFTTKRAGEGTGLGLSTAYGIIKQTGGFIFADSIPGEGTCFMLILPALNPVAQQVAQEPADGQAAPCPCGGVVLLVEDEAPVRAFASRALQMRGFTVLEADTGEAALDLLKDEDTRIDVFVTDVIMPGLDGPGWVRKAITSRPETRVVFMSGYARESFGDVQADIPNSTFLPKPFSLSELTETVSRQMSEVQAGAGEGAAGGTATP